MILDVDPGHDDAVALMMACGAPGLNLLAVTTVAGNVELEKTTYNALRVLSLIGCTDAPVAAGADAPLTRSLHTAYDVHGESGLDGPEPLEPVFDAPPLHDPVAVAAVLQPELLTTRPMRVDVECQSDLTRGETVCDFYGVTGKPPNAEVGVELDREGFFELLYATLGDL